MKAINIYTYSRIQEDMATEFENILSKRSKKLKVKPQEFYAIDMEKHKNKTMNLI